MVNIITGFEKINTIIKACITTEMTENGLLSDVETFINTYYNEGQVDEPVIWITQHPTTVSKGADISKTLLLKHLSNLIVEYMKWIWKMLTSTAKT